MNYFALFERDCLVPVSGRALSADDLLLLEQAGCVADRWQEETSDLDAVLLRSDAVLPEGYERQPIRSVFALGNEAETHRLARAKAILSWRSATRFCPRCGHALEEHPTLVARTCPACGHLLFPRIEPCIIVVVKRGEDILLARHVQRNQDIYACIAGFMEAGETAEQTVEREVWEETGIRVKNIRYFGSQSWPFPAQLMIGFLADYAGGELRLQDDEIADARWFSPSDLPPCPRPGSIAYRLIEAATRPQNDEK